MPRVGPTYSLPEAPFDPNTLAQSVRVNNNFTDIATALSDSLTRGETTAFTRSLLDDPDAATARQTLGVAWNLLDNITVTNGASTVEVALPTTHTAFELQVLRAAPSVSAALGVQVSFDNGATWWSGASAYSISWASLTAAGAFSGTASSSLSAALLGPACVAAASNGMYDARVLISPSPGVSPGLTNLVSSATVLNAVGGLAFPAPITAAAHVAGTNLQPNRLRVLWGGGATFTTTNRNTRVILSGVRA